MQRTALHLFSLPLELPLSPVKEVDSIESKGLGKSKRIPVKFKTVLTIFTNYIKVTYQISQLTKRSILPCINLNLILGFLSSHCKIFFRMMTTNLWIQQQIVKSLKNFSMYKKQEKD